MKCNGGGGPDPLAREKGLYLDELFAGVPDFLVTPLLMEPVCLISQSQFEYPVRPWANPAIFEKDSGEPGVWSTGSTRK